MKSFVRALRPVLQYRLTLLGVLLTSALVAVAWGANIGAVYPFIEVVFEGKSLRAWIDGEIAQAEKRIAELETSIRQQRRRLAVAMPPEEKNRLACRIDFNRTRLGAEQKALAGYRRLRPYVYRYLPREAFSTLVVIVLALLAGTLLKSAFFIANVILVGRATEGAMFDLRTRFYRRTLRMELASFDEDRSSRLMSRFTFDMECLSTGLSTLLGQALREPLKMIVCVFGAALISWRLLLFSLILAPPLAYLIRRLAGSIKRASRRAMEEMSQLYNLLSETFAGIRTVKAFTMEAAERDRFELSARQYYRKAMRIVCYCSLSKPTTELLGIGVICLAILAGAYLVLNRQTHLLGIRMSDRPMSIASLLFFFAFLAGASDPARKLANVFNVIQRAAAAADRIFQMLDREPAIIDPAKPRSVPSPHTELVFDHVDFHYVQGQPVLKDVNLRIPFGETLAVVGPNGCGKSTLTNLILRFYDPCGGAVLLDGVDLREMSPNDLRRRIGLVQQRTFLFDDTVLANIRYGSPEATEEEVIRAARQARADRFINEELEAGYDTAVGQGGNRLSGGQCQRIALARAILRDPEILVLDEATSQVDLQSEQLIHKALEEFADGRTTIMITHRPSTLALADRILVMDAGSVVDLGTHEELAARCDLYRRLHQGQFRQSA